MWSFFQSSFSPSAKWYQSTSSNSTKQATHYNTPKPVTLLARLVRTWRNSELALPSIASATAKEKTPLLEQLAVALGSWEAYRPARQRAAQRPRQLDAALKKETQSRKDADLATRRTRRLAVAVTGSAISPSATATLPFRPFKGEDLTVPAISFSRYAVRYSPKGEATAVT